nr:unnamed protein product [Callosobruchus chinensis]
MQSRVGQLDLSVTRS